MSSLISIKNLSVEFNTPDQQVRAVNKISFEIPAGKNIALVGESGSGKSVTALSLLRLHDEKKVNYGSGKIVFNQQDILSLAEPQMRAIRGRDISMIFQEPMTSLNPVYPVGVQLIEPLLLHRNVTKVQAKKQAMELLERVGIAEPQHQFEKFPHMMSGGQRQRVMIAMALACHPKLLIADEPTTALDVTIQKQILELLADLQKEMGMAVLMITHDLNLVRHYADYVCVMKDGEIVEQAEKSILLSQPQHAYTQQLLDSEPPRNILSLPESANTLLTTENLSVSFPVKKGFFKKKVGEVKAVDHVSLQLSQGETLGIVGESGSGKTTLGMALLRMQASRGDIYFDGIELQKLTEKDLRPLRKEFQIVFQDPFSALSPRMTVEQILNEGLSLHFPDLNKQQRRTQILQVLEDVGLDEASLWRYPHEFSGGQRQRIAIARVVVLKPKLLLLDEPTSALDVSVQKQVLELLLQLQKKYGLSYLFISHDLKVIRAISHRVMVIQNGCVVEQGDTETLFETPRHDYTRQLLQAALL